LGGKITTLCVCHIIQVFCDLKVQEIPLWVWIPLMARCTWCNKVCQWLAAGRWFCPGTRPPVSSTDYWYSWNIVESGVKHHSINPHIKPNLVGVVPL